MELSSWLLEKLALVALQEDSEKLYTVSQIVKNPVASIPKQILGHLRWLNWVENGQALTDKLLEILDATPETIQIEIIGHK